MKRREFLKNTSLLAAGAMLPSSLHAALPAPAKTYDIIIVGAGPAGSIVATRLVQRFPSKKILLLEAGGPTSAEVGGQDFPPYDAQATIFDVPGISEHPLPAQGRALPTKRDALHVPGHGLRW